MSPTPPPIDNRPTVDGRSNRRASLTVRATKSSLFRTRGKHFVILTASNGEPLLYGETHPTYQHAKKSKDAVIRAMIQVLENEGYRIYHQVTS